MVRIKCDQTGRKTKSIKKTDKNTRQTKQESKLGREKIISVEMALDSNDLFS